MLSQNYSVAYEWLGMAIPGFIVFIVGVLAWGDYGSRYPEDFEQVLYNQEKAEKDAKIEASNDIWAQEQDAIR